MTTFARSPQPRAATRSRLLGGLALALMLLAALIGAASAQAVVAEVEGVQVGVQPRNGTGTGTPGAKPATFANEAGNAVLHGSGDYAIYWDPNDQFHHEWLVNIDGFMHHLGEADLATPFADLGQYRDRSNAITPFSAQFKGAYSDTATFPAAGCTDPNPLSVGAVTCLTATQLSQQLQSFVATHNLPKGMGTVYFLLTPPGVTVCLDAAATHCSDYTLSAKEEAEGARESVSYKNSFCSYHGDVNPDSAPQGDGNTILYATIPWTAGLAGLGGYDYASLSKQLLYGAGFDCQDGGYNPEKHEETREVAKERTAAEEEALAKETPEKKAEVERERRLEGPHVEEPNQEPKELGEVGDYAAGLSDLIVNQIAVQEMNIVTDPLLTSWKDAAGNEVTDLCRNAFDSTAGPGGGEIEGSVTAHPNTEAGTLSNVSVGGQRYYVNNIFNAADAHCSGGVGLVPRFTVPNPINAGEIFGADGMESTVSLIAGDAFGPTGPPTPTYATFTWNFGDGTSPVKGYAPGAPTCEAPWLSPCAASAFHSYQYGGTYQITLTVTDVAGDSAQVEHDVTVDGPQPPAPASPGSSASSSSSSGTPGATATPSALPAPVAAAAVVSRSLRKALRSGVVVRYSVNEQVAGRFEVMISRALAKHLKIGGAPAVGLPAGTAPQVVIGKALLVTTRAGRSTISIRLSRSAARRLAHVHGAAVLLRLFVRNAKSAGSATVISTARLAG